MYVKRGYYWLVPESGIGIRFVNSMLIVGFT